MEPVGYKKFEFMIDLGMQFTKFFNFVNCIPIGAELAGAAGARAPPLFNPRPEIYSIKCA